MLVLVKYVINCEENVGSFEFPNEPLRIILHKHVQVSRLSGLVSRVSDW